MTKDLDQRIAQKGRHTGLVIAAVMVLWLGAQVLGSKMGLPVRFVFLFDLAALAGFIYAGVNIFQIWQMRQNSQG